MRGLPGLWALTGAALWLAISAPASASDSVRIELEGSISVACGVGTAAGAFDFQAALRGAPQRLSLGVDCNVPYTLVATSLNGGLLTDAPSAPGIANHVAYDLRVAVPTTGGGQVALACASAQLAASAPCATADSGNEISIGQMADVTMTLKGQGEALAAGTYDDVIMIQVLPRT